MKKSSFSYIPLGLVFVYYVLLTLFVEIRPEHIAVSWAYLILYYTHPKTRTWCKDLLPFGLYGAIYDFLRAYPKKWAGPIQVAGPYRLEKFLFGFGGSTGRVTPNEFFQFHQHVVFDVIGGVMYSMHVIGPIFLAIALWFTHRKLSREFLWTYLLSGVLSLVTYVILPVAPPWYVSTYGLVPAHWGIPGNAAGLVRFDQLIGMPYYQNLFAKNAWAFGAVPSMHGGHAFMVGYFGWLAFRRRGLFLGIYPLLMWFSIVYLNHHYIIDILAGAFYVLVSHALVKEAFKKKPHHSLSA